MRKALVIWLAGLLGVTSITGCGMFRASRHECADGCCGVGSAQPKQAASQPARRIAMVEMETMEPPERIVLAENPMPLQELPASPKVVELPVVPKIDIAAQEEAIVRRELAAQQSNPALCVVDEMPRRPAAAEANVLVPETVISNVPASAPEKEKTVAIKTVEIHYGQSDNFKSITGQVDQYRKTWRLRYADIGQADPHGGVVVLEGGDQSKLRDGQHINVTGVLVPAATRTGSAVYRVQNIEILD